MTKSKSITPESQALLRALPSVDHLLTSERLATLINAHGRQTVVHAAQSTIDEARQRILAGNADAPDESSLITCIDLRLSQGATPSLRRVINATGVMLHTGLGRAPLANAAIEAIRRHASGYANLELDLSSGARGRRADHVASLLTELTGAEAATVVNNNAAATLLILNTLARGAEVVVSRGELVEIGGSYRLPEMMTASGAKLREVGTTNRTRITDYERAIGEQTAALMRVHTSNFRVVGFSENVDIAALTALGKHHNIPVIDDLGSGALTDAGAFGLTDEPLVRASITAGADIVCFSGDKLLGGPQAGVIVGRSELVRRIEANPLMRTYRTGKLTLAALEATLRLHRDPQHARTHVPALRMLSTNLEDLEARAGTLVQQLKNALPNDSFEVIADQSVAGGGSMPARALETRCVAWQPASQSVSTLLDKLRASNPPIVARAKHAKILFDVRTLSDEELTLIAEGIQRVAIPA